MKRVIKKHFYKWILAVFMLTNGHQAQADKDLKTIREACESMLAKIEAEIAEDWNKSQNHSVDDYRKDFDEGRLGDLIGLGERRLRENPNKADETEIKTRLTKLERALYGDDFHKANDDY